MQTHDQDSVIPLSLYIHFPWCVKKCPYCDFNSHQLKTDLTDLSEKKYLQILIQDIKADLKIHQSALKNRKIHSIFMGGGTPSLFSPESIGDLLQAVKNLIDFEHPDIEITLEANPGTVEQFRFQGFKQAGINRLSIGVQSFNPAHLKKLGRIHDDISAYNAVNSAKQAGFTNFNIDLMHGLPCQTTSEALEDINAALSLSPPHLSWYQLTLEPNTLFYHAPPVLPVEDILGEIEQQGNKLLNQSCYAQYEVSAYCQKNFECLHNLNYWSFGDYLGIGAGAHGKITDISLEKIYRTVKPKHPKEYLSYDFTPSKNLSNNIITVNQPAFEFMLNALRLQKPVLWALFLSRTFLSRESILDILDKLQHKNLINYNQIHFEPTALGRKFLNTVLTEFLI